MSLLGSENNALDIGSCKRDTQMDATSGQETATTESVPQFISPIAQPLLTGKLLDRSLRLLKKVVSYEHTMKDTTVKSKTSVRQLKRGVAEVTKAVRKGQKGIIFLASDVYPIDIIAHFPAFCEDKDVLYCFVGSKRKLGTACHTKRPASVVMLLTPSSDMPHSALYDKFSVALRELHPFF